MSAFFSWQHAIRAAKIEPTTKLVLYSINTRMAMDGTGCFPSYNTIADDSGLSRRTVIEHVQKGVEHGFLEVTTRKRVDGTHTSNLYSMLMPGGGAAAAPCSAPGALGGGAPDAPQGTTQSQNSSPSNQKKASRRAANPAIRLIEHLGENPTLPREWAEWAIAEFGWDASRLRRLWDEFSDYWRSGNAVGGGRKADWAATWRGHCRRAADRQGFRSGASGGGAGQGGSGGRDIVAAARDRTLADIFGVLPPFGGWAPDEPAAGADPWGGGASPTVAGAMDVSPSYETGLSAASGSAGSDTDCDARTAVPLAAE